VWVSTKWEAARVDPVDVSPAITGVLERGKPFAGDVYRSVGEKLEIAGQMALSFSSADRGVLRYRLGGLDFRGPIIRQSFSRLTSHCRETVPGSILR
jgi:hypothetical protein